VRGKPLHGGVGDSGDGDDGGDGERDHCGGGVVLELTADVAARVGAVTEGQDIERDERGDEGGERDHVHMIGHERGRT